MQPEIKEVCDKLELKLTSGNIKLLIIQHLFMIASADFARGMTKAERITSEL